MANENKETDLLQQALAELEAAIRPLEKEADINPTFDLTQFYYYLHLIWAEFHIYILDPFGGGEGAASDTAKIIPLENGRKIFDYGFALSTSVGEDYGSYCQGRLYEAIEAMVAMLAQRGVKKVSFIGNSVAMRVAWMACVDQQIETANYEPGYDDIATRNRVLALKEKARKLTQELRI